MATEVAVAGLPRVRRVGFYTVIALAIVLVVFGLGELLYLGVVGWLGESALEEATQPGAGVHLFHVLTHSLFAWLLLISLAAQLRHAGREFAAGLFALLAMVTYSLGTLISGIFDPLEVVAIVLLGAAVWLNPGREGALATPLRRRALLASIPAVAGASLVVSGEVGRQVNAVGADQHAEFGHYGLMAAMAVILILAALIGSSSFSGRRLVAGLAVAGLMYMGVAAIVFPDQTSSIGVVGGVATIGAGLLYAWGAMSPQHEET